MINCDHLELRLHQDDLWLIRCLIAKTKTSERLVDAAYLDLLTLDKASAASAAAILALPEALRLQPAIMYLSYREFRTLLDLTGSAAKSRLCGGRFLKIWNELTIAEVQFEADNGGNPGGF